MSYRVEWMGQDTTGVEAVGHGEELLGDVIEAPASISFGQDQSIFVIEGTREGLVKMLEGAIEKVKALPEVTPD